MPVEFLTDEQAEAYGTFTEAPTRTELERFFFLDECVSLLALEPGPRTTGDIADLTGLTSGSATRLVDRLQKAGLAERHPDPHDRRKVLVTLTRGRTPEIEAAWDTPGKAFDQALEDFTDDELTIIERYLRRTTDVGTAQTARLRAD